MLRERLRVACSPDDPVAPGEHKHLCDCGACWKHNREELCENCTDREFKLAHRCPDCGADVRQVYYPETPLEELLDDLIEFLRKASK